MATNTYVALDKVTVSDTTTNTITFNSISGSYTDLQLVISGYTITGSGAFVALRFNSDTTSNYSTTYMWGNGSTATSSRQTSQTSSTIGAFYSTQANIIANIQNYSNATTYKTVVSRSNSAADNTGAFVSLWRATPAAITSMTVLTTGGEYFNNGATFSLYGIASQGASAKATGGYITSDSTYYYHTFLASDTFTPLQSLSADILVVAGGGGGGTRAGGGGGAGGLLGFTSQSLTATGYTVTVGAGGSGAAASPNTASGSVGSDSQFGALTLVKGGGTGGGATVNGGNGGSGGGGGNSSSAGGSASPSGQGNNGAVGGSSNGGGGGGSSAAGTSGSSGGNGGSGLSTYSSWGSATGTGQNVSGTYYYAGGGAGGGSYSSSTGTGGSGGGGNGGPTNDTGQGFVGTTNTGGGGGGGSSKSNGTNTAGGAGGSGIVIVRYTK